MNFNRVILLSGGVKIILKDEIIYNKHKLLRIITLSDLVDQMDCFESTSIEIHFKQGLPKDIDKLGTISIFNLKDKKLKFHSFSSLNLKNQINSFNQNSQVIYDIPIYNKLAPSGFSLFMTKQEKEMIDNFIYKKGGSKVFINAEENSQYYLLNCNNTIQNPDNIPLPRKEHSFCHLCRMRYEEYLNHLKSSIHIANNNKNSDNFTKITKTFERIRFLWANKTNEEETNNNKETLNITRIQLELCTNDILNNISTKYETCISQNKNNVNNNNINHSLTNKENFIIPVSFVKDIYDENKENFNSQNIQGPGVNLIKNYKNKELSTPNKMSLQKRKFSSDFNLETFETELNNNYKVISRNKLTKKKKEFSRVVQNMDKLKYLVGKSFKMNIK